MTHVHPNRSILRNSARIAIALLGVLVVSSCSDGSSKLLPCPPEGLGRAEFAGVSASDQILRAKEYACEKAQICPDNAVASIDNPVVVSNTDAPRSVTVGITNCSTGNQRLIIDQVVLFGDENRCSFTCAERIVDPEAVCKVNVEKDTVDPGETISIEILYQPEAPGEDHAQFRVFSNAENYPTLKIPMCSKAISASGPSADAGTTPSDGGVGAPEALFCIAPKAVNTRCHAARKVQPADPDLAQK